MGSLISRPRCVLLAAVLAGVVASLAVIGSASPMAAAQDAERERLRVVTTELAPFVIREGERPTGFYWEIWEDVAAELDVGFQVEWVDSFDELISALQEGQADVAVAPLAPTAEREAIADFSSAVITSGPQLGVHDRTRGSASILRALVGSRVLRLVILAIIGLVVLGHLIWLVERNDDDNDFHPSYLLGVWDGIWWAAATVTTVGYGDKAPTSGRGRLIAMFAMLLSLFLVGAFVTEVSGDFAAQQEQVGVSSVETLDGRSVAVVEGSTFAGVLESQGAKTEPFDSQADAFDAVADGRVDVVLASPFALADQGPEHGVSAAGDVLYEEFETFGLAQNSELREPINGALADLQAAGTVQATIDRWLD